MGWKVGTVRGCEKREGQCILFYVVFTPSTSSHHGSVWFLPVISLLLINTVSPVRPAYPYDWRGLVGAEKKTTVELIHFIPRWDVSCNSNPPSPLE
jgi:hypothetical protein